MTDKKPDEESEVTPKGAVEVKEEELDKAAGGISGYSAPSDPYSINFAKTLTSDPLVQKVAPTETLTIPEKKI